eukprot:TRINITY_DN4486_c0_g1_i1.p1 TRINITY_DN4486_c0_g1~~TRINITY_DN4486_c0_g1_i1.p1  ORF type:complete len:908 (+),score=253.17 TRINITY_DN4486_c0_g1_i1:346-2724(+)
MPRCSLDDTGAAALIEAAVDFRHLQVLDLFGNRVGLSMDVVGQALSKAAAASSLKVLNLGGNAIGPDGAAALARGLLTSQARLRQLHLGDNNLGDAGLRHLLGAIIRIRKDEGFCLTLRRNGLTHEAAQHIVTIISGGELEELQLKDNPLGDQGAVILAQGLREAPLGRLELTNCGIGPRGAQALAQALANPACRLRALSLNNNSIRDDGARALADALCGGSVVQTLGLRNNGIGSGGGTVLARALSRSCFLAGLDISDNPSGDATACALADSLPRNFALTSLDLHDTDVGVRGSEAIARALHPSAGNSTLTHIDISGSRTGDRGAMLWADTLRENTCLRRLGLALCSIGRAGCQKLFNAISRNQALENITLHAPGKREEGDPRSNSTSGDLRRLLANRKQRAARARDIAACQRRAPEQHRGAPGQADRDDRHISKVPYPVASVQCPTQSLGGALGALSEGAWRDDPETVSMHEVSAARPSYSSRDPSPDAGLEAMIGRPPRLLEPGSQAAPPPQPQYYDGHYGVGAGQPLQQPHGALRGLGLNTAPSRQIRKLVVLDSRGHPSQQQVLYRTTEYYESQTWLPAQGDAATFDASSYAMAGPQQAPFYTMGGPQQAVSYTMGGPEQVSYTMGGPEQAAVQYTPSMHAHAPPHGSYFDPRRESVQQTMHHRWHPGYPVPGYVPGSPVRRSLQRGTPEHAPAPQLPPGFSTPVSRRSGSCYEAGMASASPPPLLPASPQSGRPMVSQSPPASTRPSAEGTSPGPRTASVSPADWVGGQQRRSVTPCAISPSRVAC